MVIWCHKQAHLLPSQILINTCMLHWNIKIRPHDLGHLVDNVHSWIDNTAGFGEKLEFERAWGRCMCMYVHGMSGNGEVIIYTATCNPKFEFPYFFWIFLTFLNSKVSNISLTLHLRKLVVLLGSDWQVSYYVLKKSASA